MTDDIWIGLDLELLRTGPGLLGFRLPGGDTHWAVRSDFVDLGDGNVVWRGRETSSTYSSVLMRLHDGRLLGTFVSGDDEWMVMGRPTGSSLRKVVRGHYPHEYHSHPHPHPPHELEPHGVSEAPVSVESASASKVILDILILYTEEARQYVEDPWVDHLGDEHPAVYEGYTVSDLAHLSNSHVNAVLQNGQIPTVTRIVGVRKMPEPADPGVGNSHYDPNHYNAAYDDYGYDFTLDAQTFDEGVKKLRGQYQADIVYAFIYDDSGYVPCGETWGRQRGYTNDWFAEYASSYVNLFCDSPQLYSNKHVPWRLPYHEVMAHEIGHLHGAEHDVSMNWVPSSEMLFHYGHGHFDGEIETVMSRFGRAKYVPYFSSVRVNPDGMTIGESGHSENERVMRKMAATTAEFSDHILKPPHDPTDLHGVVRKVSGKYRVSLYWTDNASNEMAYVVKYGRTKKNKVERADPFDHTQTYPRSTHPNLTTALILDLEPRKTYSFKVQAVNGDGFGESEVITLRMK